MKNTISNTTEALLEVNQNMQCNKITSAMELADKTVSQNCQFYLVTRNPSRTKCRSCKSTMFFALNDVSFFSFRTKTKSLPCLAIILSLKFFFREKPCVDSIYSFWSIISMREILPFFVAFAITK